MVFHLYWLAIIIHGINIGMNSSVNGVAGKC
jgi:hypothetical protein